MKTKVGIFILGCILSFLFGIAFSERQYKKHLETQKSINYAKGVTWQFDHNDSIKNANIIESDSMMVVQFIYFKKK